MTTMVNAAAPETRAPTMVTISVPYLATVDTNQPSDSFDAVLVADAPDIAASATALMGPASEAIVKPRMRTADPADHRGHQRRPTSWPAASFVPCRQGRSWRRGPQRRRSTASPRAPGTG